jgi:membrane-bound metal-dependent hydrolase YbcI (DUF457 family)
MSVLSFGLSQVAIDIEPLLAFVFAWPVLHGWTHTYLGATLIAAIVTALGRRPSLWIVRRWNQELRYHKLDRFQSPDTLTWGQVAAGAFVGTYSHVAIDSLMHPDMRPFAPFSPANPLLDLASYDAVSLVCALLIVAGIAAWALWPRPRA